MTTASSSEKFYDRFTFLYPIIDLFLKPQKHKFFKFISDFPSGQVLEVGVGNGSHFDLYSNHVITGIDTSKGMLERARNCLKEHIKVYHMKGEKLLFTDEVFDYVVLSHVIAVVDDPEKLLREAHRVLKPHGKVFILNHVTPNSWLRHVDKVFSIVGRSLHFKSFFHLSGLHALERFTLRSESNAGLFSYFKILTYEKNA